MEQYFIVKIDSYEGADTYVHCGDETQDFIFAVVVVDESGDAEIVDNGYRSRGEAASAWPEAVSPKASRPKSRK